MPKEKKGILFVCLGNICRSTMAEGIFNNVIKERGVQDQWIVDSAATSTYQIGNPPDERAKKVMRKHHMTMDHRARQITAEDFTKFKYIFGMDKENIRDLKSVKPPGSESEILMLGKYDPETKNGIIEDPYFESGEKPFETVFEQCLRSCNNFLDSLSDS